VGHVGQNIMQNDVFIANLKTYLFIGTLKLRNLVKQVNPKELD
jgi:hypothetical protein